MRQAIDAATTGPVAEGVVGAGTGMSTMGHKGGIGTASRVLDGFGTVGVLLLCNFGGSKLLRIGGVPVGETITAEREVAPDARRRRIVHRHRVDGHPARRPPARARRPPGRLGTWQGRFGRPPRQRRHLLRRVDHEPPPTRFATGFIETRLLADKSLDAVFTAVVDASEEAVTNALFVADTVTGVNGHTVPGLPVDRVLELIRRCDPLAPSDAG